MSFLFGNILGITNQDLFVIILVTIITCTFYLLLSKTTPSFSIHTETAQVYGVRTTLVDTLFSLVLAGVVIASMTSIGVTLLAAAIVAPAICARMLTNNFNLMIILSSGIGVTTSFVGLVRQFLF